ncbi:MAG TPA: hypothetical protein VGC87_13845 [Pyrinomonadaceae bacterium]|jgi:hypothetical protein
MRTGVTGHQRLHEPAGWEWVEREVDRFLSSLSPPLICVTSLAVGADQLFANAVLRRGGALEVILPFPEYETTFTETRDRREYARLLSRASEVEVLERHGSDEDAYLASGKRMVDTSELILAVWDGRPAAGRGGTGDIVSYAVRQRKRTVHLNPVAREVTEL